MRAEDCILYDYDMCECKDYLECECYGLEGCCGYKEENINETDN